MKTGMKEFLGKKAMYQQFDNKSLLWTLDDVIHNPDRLGDRMALLAVIEERMNASGDTHTFDDTMNALSAMKNA